LNKYLDNIEEELRREEIAQLNTERKRVEKSLKKRDKYERLSL